jgi:hypothetical protein
LFSSQFGAILETAMKRWSIRQIFVLFLAVFVTTGMGLSVVRANDMALTMAMPSDMGASGHDGCAGCPGGDSSGAKAMPCAVTCVAPVLALLPQVAPTPVAPVAATYPAYGAVLHGRAPVPDPGPPRTTDIG